MIAGVLLCAELAARLLNLGPPLPTDTDGYVRDPFIGYKRMPNSVLTGRSTDGEFSYRYVNNHLGFRDVEHQEEKPPGVFRILGLGDSFTYGVGAPFEQTYLVRLGAMLNARPGAHPPVEVINEGVPKFFAYPERLTLEHYGLRLSPDLVLVAILPNDISDTAQGLESVEIEDDGTMVTHKAAQLGLAGRWLFVHSRAGRILLRRYVSWSQHRHYPVYREDIYEPNGRHEKDWQSVEAELVKIATLCSDSSSKLVLIHIPQGSPALDTEAAVYPPARLAGWAKVHGVYFIDTLPGLRDGGGPAGLYWPQDGHCTPAGYELIAKSVYRGLVNDGLVP